MAVKVLTSKLVHMYAIEHILSKKILLVRKRRYVFDYAFSEAKVYKYKKVAQRVADKLYFPYGKCRVVDVYVSMTNNVHEKV